MFSGRTILFRLSRQPILLQRRTLCNGNKPITLNSGKQVENSSSLSRQDAYKQLENLDFMTAAKMLFTESPQKKKFGFDFHLVQFFFACLPSLAVYLVAQYARYEMRRMEAEQEVKKQAEEAKAKQLEFIAEENQKVIDPQLSEVKARLDKLEETVKEIAVMSKKQQSGDVADNAVKKEPGTSERGTPKAQEKTTPPSEGKPHVKVSLPDQNQIKNEGSSHDTNR